MSFRATGVVRITRRRDRHESFRACSQDRPTQPPTQRLLPEIPHDMRKNPPRPSTNIWRTNAR